MCFTLLLCPMLSKPNIKQTPPASHPQGAHGGSCCCRQACHRLRNGRRTGIFPPGGFRICELTGGLTWLDRRMLQSTMLSTGGLAGSLAGGFIGNSQAVSLTAVSLGWRFLWRFQCWFHWFDKV